MRSSEAEEEEGNAAGRNRRETDLESRESRLRSPYNHNKLGPGISPLQRTLRLDQEGRARGGEETNSVEVG